MFMTDLTRYNRTSLKLDGSTPYTIMHYFAVQYLAVRQVFPIAHTAISIRGRGARY